MGNPALAREPTIDRDELVKIWWDKRAHEHVSDALREITIPSRAASPDEQEAYDVNNDRIAQTVRSNNPDEWDVLELGSLVARRLHHYLHGTCDQEVDDV